MRPNLQETVDLVTFTEEIFNGNFIFWAVMLKWFNMLNKLR